MSRKKLLIADDSSVVLMTEQMILGKIYDLSTAKDGQEAYNKALAEKPDLILLDVIMPKMNGIEVCQKLREQESTKSIPIIMVTTRGEQVNIEKAYNFGCTDYVTKPFNGNQLLSKIKTYLGD